MAGKFPALLGRGNWAKCAGETSASFLWHVYKPAISQTAHQNLWPACDLHISDLQGLMNWSQWQPHKWVPTLATWTDVNLAVVRPGPNANSSLKLLVLYSHPDLQRWLSWRPRWTPDSPVLSLCLLFSDTRGHPWPGLDKEDETVMPTAKHARKYPGCLAHWLTPGLPTSVPGPVPGTCQWGGRQWRPRVLQLGVQTQRGGQQRTGTGPPKPGPQGMNVHPAG